VSRKGLALSAVAAVVVAFGASGRARANLVTNASFESYTGGFGTPAAPSQLADSGSGAGYTTLTGWTIGPGSSGTLAFLIASGAGDTTGSHDVRFNDTFTLWGPSNSATSDPQRQPGNPALTASSPDGGNYVALDGAATYRGAGLSQTLTGLSAGRVYQVSFFWAAAQQHGFDGPTTESVQVTFGSSSQTTAVYNLASHAFSGWMFQSFNFTASAASQTLNFLAIATPDGQPPFALLDGVTVVQQVPEPGTMSLLVTGLLGVGVARLRQRAMAAARAKTPTATPTAS
jgi:hypothetical protein